MISTSILSSYRDRNEKHDLVHKHREQIIMQTKYYDSKESNLHISKETNLTAALSEVIKGNPKSYPNPNPNPNTLFIIAKHLPTLHQL